MMHFGMSKIYTTSARYWNDIIYLRYIELRYVTNIRLPKRYTTH